MHAYIQYIKVNPQIPFAANADEDESSNCGDKTQTSTGWSQCLILLENRCEPCAIQNQFGLLSLCRRYLFMQHMRE